MDDKLEDFREFLANQEEATCVYDFVVEIYTGQPSRTKEVNDDVVTFSDNQVLGMIGVVLAAVIYKAATILLNSVRNKQELADAKAKIEMIQSLKDEEGIPLDKATKMVERTLETIAKRSEKDPAIQAILEYLKSNKKS